MSKYKLIQPSTLDDHLWLVELHNDPEVLFNLTNPNPISLLSHLEWWTKLNKEKNPRYIFTIDGEKIGFVKIYNLDLENKNCLLGGDIHKKHRGKGYSYIMWNTLLQYCFEELDLFRVGLTTAEYNKIAKKVYKKLGFVTEGFIKKSLFRKGAYYDQECMYLLKSNYYEK